MELSEIYPIAYLIVDERFGQKYSRVLFPNELNVDAFDPSRGDTELYTLKQMEKYAESKRREHTKDHTAQIIKLEQKIYEYERVLNVISGWDKANGAELCARDALERMMK